VNVQQVNLQDIRSFYYERRTASTAAETLRQMITKRDHLQLANLLRDHRRKSVYSKRERYMRACVDDLLVCYNVLEISILTKFLAKPDKSVFWEEAGLILGNKQVRRYIEDFYPVRLPQLLALRLNGDVHHTEKKSGDLSSIMIQFLALDRGFIVSLNDSYLLSMLDSFTIQGYRFRDVVALIDNPKRFVRRILLPPAERSIPDRTLQELSHFFQFALNLNELLQSLDRYPLVQSEIWNHYSYWFEIIGQKLNRKLGAALDRFLRWEAADSRDQAALEIQEYVANARRVIELLTSTRYATSVSKQLENYKDR